MLNREARLTKYQSQLLQIMFVWLLIAIVELIVSGKMTPARVITFAPPLSYFTSHYLLLIRRKWIGEMMLWTFILGITTRDTVEATCQISRAIHARIGADQISHGDADRAEIAPGLVR